jgi:hypothetical protein
MNQVLLKSQQINQQALSDNKSSSRGKKSEGRGLGRGPGDKLTGSNVSAAA